jgi:outer membrane protein assembly factor BamB
MVAFGQIESVWPALGSVLVHEGIVYATAGRETEVDGGIAIGAFNAATGKQLWASVLQPEMRYQNDIRVCSISTEGCN